MPMLAKITIHKCQCARCDHKQHFKIPAQAIQKYKEFESLTVNVRSAIITGTLRYQPEL